MKKTTTRPARSSPIVPARETPCSRTIPPATKPIKLTRSEEQGNLSSDIIPKLSDGGPRDDAENVRGGWLGPGLFGTSNGRNG